MSNERLRAAIDQAGLTVDQLAFHVQVDSKTVRRWISGRTPRKTYRARVAQALSSTEAELWPEEELRVDGRNEAAEILAAYTHATDPASPDWRPLLANATSHVDLLDLTLTDQLNQDHVLDLLAEKGRSDCQVRLLLSAPNALSLSINDTELGQDLTINDIPQSGLDADRSLDLITPLLAGGGVDARTILAPRPNTILRFDDEMLVTLPLYATPADQAPLIHLKRHSDHGLFQTFTDQYDLLWQDARPVPPPAR